MSAGAIEWISALSSLSSAIAVMVGLFIANRQLHIWRLQSRSVRNAEAAEKLVIAAHNVADALKHIRTPFDSVPEEHQTDKMYRYEQRVQRVAGYAEKFSELRQAQIRVDVLLKDAGVYSAVEDLFLIRAEVLSAIEMLAHRSEYRDDEDGRTNKLYNELQWKMWGVFNDDDKLWRRQNEALRKVDDGLRAAIRFAEKEERK